MAKKVLLHACCGVCACACIGKLKEEGFSPIVFFFNPNIQPQTEYQKRKIAAFIMAEALGVTIIEGNYNSSAWQQAVKPYSQKAEGGQRCLACYKMRLSEAFNLLCKKGYNYFTTTLTVSPHKRSSDIIKIGKDIGGDKFLPFDFKKKNGFKKTIAAAKNLNLYQQNYCGCLDSRK